MENPATVEDEPVDTNQNVSLNDIIDEMSSDKDEIEFIRRVGTNSAFFEKEFK